MEFQLSYSNPKRWCCESAALNMPENLENSAVRTGKGQFSFQSQRKAMPKLRHAAAAAKSLQSCLTLCNPIDISPPGSPVPGILQARTLEWVAISFSNAWKWEVKVKLLSRAWLLATPWTAAYQAPPSMGFSRQEYWSGVPLPSLKLRHREMKIAQSDTGKYQSQNCECRQRLVLKCLF